MRREFLGDSYDAVKRLWAESLRQIAPLYADPAFIPSDLRVDFTRMTHIEILDGTQTTDHSILNDPDTGIFTPERSVQRVSRSHTSLQTIHEQLGRPGVKCVVTFDQSSHRKAGWSAAEQRRAKMQRIQELGRHAFYYVSHAPFMFACSTEAALSDVMAAIERQGVPASRMERCW